MKNIIKIVFICCLFLSQEVFSQAKKLGNEPIKKITGKPNLYIIAIGVPSSDLLYTKSDAEAISNHFLTQGGNLFGRVESTVMVCKNNTSYSDVGEILEKYPHRGDIRKQDVLIVFISSHGTDINGFGIVCSSNKANPGEYSKYTTINYEKDIIANINSIECKRILFFDACYSGQAGGKSTDFSKIQEQISKTPPSIITFASSRGDEKSYEDKKWKHGAFTKVILEGLDGRADISNDSLISIQELVDYVKLAVPDTVKKIHQEQHPYLAQKIEKDFTIFNYKTKAPLENKIENCEEKISSNHSTEEVESVKKNNVAVIGLKSDDLLNLDIQFSEVIKKEITEKNANGKGDRPISITPNPASNKAVKNGAVKRLISGDEGARRLLDPMLNADYLLIFLRSPSIFRQETVEGSPIWVASINIKYFKISVLTGEIVDSNECDSNGSDSQRNEAEKRSFERSLACIELSN
jgi:Caspase domain